jgi:hypothetical protein
LGRAAVFNALRNVPLSTPDIKTRNVPGFFSPRTSRC